MVGGGYYPDTKITDRDGHYLTIHSNGAITAVPVPEHYQFYFHTVIDAPGVVAANTFISVLNPVGSGKTLSFFSVAPSSFAVGASSTAVSLVADRITAASGGTQITAANINKLFTGESNSTADVRVGNPTVTTTGVTLIGWPPPLATGLGATSSAYSTPPPGQGFTCIEGQGVAFSTSAGNTNQRWTINLNWAEF